MTEVDVVVVGGGSSGCVVAGRLASETDLSVLLLEAGGRAEDHPETLSARGYKDAFVNDAVIWTRHTAPQRALGGRRIFVGTGTGMGGSGSVNGMVYTRGAREDYASWPEGWRWDDILPAFEGVEARLRPGPRPPTRWTEAAIAAAETVGFRRSEDLGNGDLSGVFGYQPMNHDGEMRRNSYVGFIKEQRGSQPNLTVLTQARTTQILFEEGRAVGVRYLRDGQVHEVRATREVVLCAGTLETPKLLMLSGVGPAQHLREHGIEVVADLPGIGANLHDHPNVILLFRGTREEVDCIQPQLYGFHRAHPDLDLPAHQADTCTVMYPARSSFRQAAERMLPSMLLPSSLLETTWAPRLLRRLARWLFGTSLVRRFVDRMWGVVVILGKPVSRGTLRLRSTDIHDEALIDPAYLSSHEDRVTLRRGLERALELARSDALKPWWGGWALPLPFENLDAYARRQLITTYHFAGTCRMGDDEDAPVRPDLTLRGVEGIRIADASVMPETPVSALNAPSMMIGFRAADLMMGRPARS